MRRELTPFTWKNRNPLSLFDDFEKDLENFWGRPTAATPTQDFFTPAVDLEENDEAYILSFDVPGVPKKDIHLEMNDGMIKIWGERKREMESGKYTERSYGHFERAFSLPEDVDEDNIEANYENGVLFVALPKTTKGKGSKKIEVNEGKGSFLSKLLNKGKKEKEKEAIDVQ